MAKRIFIVSSSPRKGGNSDALAEEFKRGAEAAGNEVEKVNVRDIDLKFCLGCLYCQDHDRCVINDSMNDICNRVQKADILAFATPIYYYEMSGQLKTFLDRLNPLYSRENRFKEVYLLAAAAEDEPTTTDGAKKGVEGWIKCFDGVSLKRVIFGGGVTDKGEIAGSHALKEAYEAGFNA